MRRQPYPSDVSDAEWEFAVPYRGLLPEDVGQRRHDLPEVFNGLRHIVRSGALWRWMPNDLPPWQTVYRQTRRWLAAGFFEDTVDDLRAVLRLDAKRRCSQKPLLLTGRFDPRREAGIEPAMTEQKEKKQPFDCTG